MCSIVWAAVIKYKHGQVTLNNFSTPDKCFLQCSLWEKIKIDSSFGFVQLRFGDKYFCFFPYIVYLQQQVQIVH